MKFSEKLLKPMKFYQTRTKENYMMHVEYKMMRKFQIHMNLSLHVTKIRQNMNNKDPRIKKIYSMISMHFSTKNQEPKLILPKKGQTFIKQLQFHFRNRLCLILKK